MEAVRRINMKLSKLKTKAIINFRENKEYTILNIFNLELYYNDTRRMGDVKQMGGGARK